HYPHRLATRPGPPVRLTSRGMRLLPVLTACALALAVAAPASAEVTVGGGVYTSHSPSATGGAVLFSTGASIPKVPVDIQATAFFSLVKGGGYALTGE